MKTFRVSFYFKTDLRSEVIVKARDEVSALVLALAQGGDTGWADSPGFRTEITVFAPAATAAKSVYNC